MPKLPPALVIDNGDGDEPMSNDSGNAHFKQVLDAHLSRRTALKGGLGASIAALFGGVGLAGCASGTGGSGGPRIGFEAVAVSSADTVVVPKGYQVQTFIPWGTPITGSMPAFDPLRYTGADQAQQVGSHHDGMHFFPIEGRDPHKGSSSEGLLVLNHEYVEPRYMHASAVGQKLSRAAVPALVNGRRPADECRKELNAHGASVVHVRKGGNGAWEVVPSRFNRRITGLTPMAIGGPVRGTAFVQTRYSPDGTRTRGTLNNCAHGVTPWNTYMMAEENWAGYFINQVPANGRTRDQRRYGLRHSESRPAASRYGWELADSGSDEFTRFDVTARGPSATQDFRNEANGFGWMVEVDPFNPDSTPVKRTALGRFAHEGVVFQPGIEGRPVVCYSGDDAVNEYIYKFVSKGVFRKAAGVANGALLDEGTLYVARFKDDGTGEWLPLVFNQGPLGPTPGNQGDQPDPAQAGFDSQADVLINTRLAADRLGATKMDRPEWGAIDPRSGQVYFTLTNNSGRTTTDKANPREKSRWGHIIRWTEAGNDPAATRFNWDIFLLAGPENDSLFNGRPLAKEQIFNSPDGLWFDPDGRLWIQTDISESVMNRGEHAQFGNNQMLCADPRTHELRRFLVGPIGQEITGVITTPDGKTMFVNVQHPGATTTEDDFAAGRLTGTWPHQGRYGRSATLVITKEDGGVIGT
jgi:uncharacterized protein